jgi:hypothetical protein
VAWLPFDVWLAAFETPRWAEYDAAERRALGDPGPDDVDSGLSATRSRAGKLAWEGRRRCAECRVTDPHRNKECTHKTAPEMARKGQLGALVSLANGSI